MAKYAVSPTQREVTFGEEEIIVSKTDLRGYITYSNDVFQRVAGFTESELLGQPHSIIRHPDMPRCVFKLLWDVIEAGQEIFAYVKNMAKNGDFYWVFAHVTPSFDAAGNITGYHSNRRCPSREAIARIEPIYQKLLAEENGNPDAKEGMLSAYAMLDAAVKAQGVEYEAFVFSL